MTDDPFQTSKRLLEPVEHASEILFGLIMVLAITGSFSVAGAGRAEVRTMFLAALGCNLAWGVIDAVFYLMGCLAEAAHKIRVWDAVRKSDDPEEGRRAFAGALPAVVASALQPAELETVRRRLQALPEPPDRGLLRRHDWLGAMSVFFLVFLSTFPVVIPFIFMKDVKLAMRISNGIAIVLLFLVPAIRSGATSGVTRSVRGSQWSSSGRASWPSRSRWEDDDPARTRLVHGGRRRPGRALARA